MKRWLLALGAAFISAALFSCDSCNGCGQGAVSHEDQSEAGTAQGNRATPATTDASLSGDTAPEEAAPSRRPVLSPMTTAQRFVVGWASGRLEPLDSMSDGEAADLVRRAASGEAVETPLGRFSPDGPRPISFAFSERQAAQGDENTHRISFTMTMRMSEGEPVSTTHVVVVRRSDNKVISWNGPSPLSGGGV